MSKEKIWDDRSELEIKYAAICERLEEAIILLEAAEFNTAKFTMGRNIWLKKVEPLLGSEEKQMNWVFDLKIKPRPLAKKVVETSFPDKHYGEIMTYEAWSMRHIMENLVEIALQEYEQSFPLGSEEKK